MAPPPPPVFTGDLRWAFAKPGVTSLLWGVRLLVIHPEARYFAGAEKMLGHFLVGLLDSGRKVTVAVAPGSRMATLVPAGCEVVAVPNNGRFSPFTLARTLAILDIGLWTRRAYF